jgi:hypothetical protein
MPPTLVTRKPTMPPSTLTQSEHDLVFEGLQDLQERLRDSAEVDPSGDDASRLKMAETLMARLLAGETLSCQ